MTNYLCTYVDGMEEQTIRLAKKSLLSKQKSVSLKLNPDIFYLQATEKSLFH